MLNPCPNCLESFSYPQEMLDGIVLYILYVAGRVSVYVHSCIIGVVMLV